MKVEEIKLAFENNQKFELALLADLESDVLANGKSDSMARELVRTAQENLSKAYSHYTNMLERNKRIEKDTLRFQSMVKEMGIDVTDQFQKNILAGLYIDKNLDKKIKAVSGSTTSLKGTGEI